MNRVCSPFAVAAILSICSLAAGGWREEADARIEKIRKGDFAVQVVDAAGKPLAGAAVALRQTRSAFHFGTAYNGDPTSLEPEEVKYHRFLLEHFNTITPEWQMKWDIIEREAGAAYNFADIDRLMKFAADNELAVRGHNLFWPKPHRVPQWNKTLTDDQLRKRMDEYLAASVARFKGRLLCWDVCNEMLDGPYYAERFGNDIHPWFFKRVREVDPQTPLYTNEYNLIGPNPSVQARVERYVQLIRQLQARGAPVGGIGIQDHTVQRFVVAGPATTQPGGMFADPGPADVLHTLDRLGELGLPIHLTELTCVTSDEQKRADNLEMIYRVGFSHPRVEAIVLWGFWAKRHFKAIEGLGEQAALIDANWNLKPAGQRIFDMLLKEWRTNAQVTSDAEGIVRFRGFYGRYEMSATDPAGHAIKTTLDLMPQPVMKVMLK